MDAMKDEFNIPNVITDPRTRTQYSKGKFLGKVSFIRLSFVFRSDHCGCFRVVSLDATN